MFKKRKGAQKIEQNFTSETFPDACLGFSYENQTGVVYSCCWPATEVERDRR